MYDQMDVNPVPSARIRRAYRESLHAARLVLRAAHGSFKTKEHGDSFLEQVPKRAVKQLHSNITKVGRRVVEAATSVYDEATVYDELGRIIQEHEVPEDQVENVLFLVTGDRGAFTDVTPEMEELVEV